MMDDRRFSTAKANAARMRGHLPPAPVSSTQVAENGSQVFEARIKACAHAGDFERLEMLVKEMHVCGIPLSCDIYNHVIYACRRAGDVTRAEGYVAALERSGIVPNATTYNTMIDVFASVGDIDRAQAWLGRMVCKGIQPSLVTYGTVCKGLARMGEVEKVEQIMKYVEDAGMELNQYFFASLIAACGTCIPNRVERAEQAVAEAAQRGVHIQSLRRLLRRVVGHRRAATLLKLCTAAAFAKAAPESPLEPPASGAPGWAAACSHVAGRSLAGSQASHVCFCGSPYVMGDLFCQFCHAELPHQAPTKYYTPPFAVSTRPSTPPTPPRPTLHRRKSYPEEFNKYPYSSTDDCDPACTRFTAYDSASPPKYSVMMSF